MSGRFLSRVPRLASARHALPFRLALPVQQTPAAGFHGVEHQGAIKFHAVTGLHSLCRGAETTENPDWRQRALELGKLFQYATGADGIPHRGAFGNSDHATPDVRWR